ncbi:hypothetical protein D3C72_2591620 [compost metagenome]
MRLIDNDGVITVQEFIALRFRQQNTVGHQFDVAALGELVVKTHLVTNHLP